MYRLHILLDDNTTTQRHYQQNKSYDYGKFPVPSKIIEDKVLKQNPNFNYLACDISFDKDTQNKVNRFQHYGELEIEH